VSGPRPQLLAAVAKNPLAEQIRDRGAEVAGAVFRLAKNALVHSMDNAAVEESITSALETLKGFTSVVGTAATMTFAEDTIFVGGQLLRASRGIYEAAIELGKIFGRVGVAEVSFEPSLTRASLTKLGTLLAMATRDPEHRDALLDAEIPGIRVREADADLMRTKNFSALPPEERMVRFYATALVVMRQFFEDVSEGRALSPHRVKRLAQRMVAMSLVNDPAFLGLTAMASAHRDDAGRAVLGAILSLVIGREITQSRSVLARLAMSALMSESGRVRMSAGRSAAQVSLSDSDEAAIPATTALVCIVTGGVNPPSAARAVSAFEATWLEQVDLNGPLYGGAERPGAEAEVIAFVRKLVLHLAPRDATPALGPAEALDAMARDADASRFLLRILVRALGIIPIGSVVELDSGEWAVVVGSSAYATASPLPMLHVVTDGKGQPLAEPRPLDLGSTFAGVTPQQIVRVLKASEARFNTTKAFVG
jgi:hypothetical protein